MLGFLSVDDELNLGEKKEKVLEGIKKEVRIQRDRDLVHYNVNSRQRKVKSSVFVKCSLESLVE